MRLLIIQLGLSVKCSTSARRGRPCGSYYEYVKGKTHQELTETGVSDEMRRIFQEHRRRYGSRRLRAEMQANGYKIGRHGIRKLLKAQGLKAIQPRSFVPKTTQSNGAARAAWIDGLS